MPLTGGGRRLLDSLPSRGREGALVREGALARGPALSRVTSHHLGGAELIGPLLTGLSQPVDVFERGFEFNDIVQVAAVAVVDAQESGRPYGSLAGVRPDPAGVSKP